MDLARHSIYPVIMCGGAGTRLWPASRPSRPKQFMALAGTGTLFQQTVRRVLGIGGFRHLVVVTGENQAAWVQGQLRGLTADATVLLEPMARDSAPAMAAAAHWIAGRDPQAVAVFVASDHFIPDTAMFVATVNQAVEVAGDGKIVTLGIRPSTPNTAYGYIRPAPGPSAGAVPVSAFVEKPDRATAERYIAEGYLWNSGNFIASVPAFIAELETYAPDVNAQAQAAVASAALHPLGLKLGAAFASAPKISIDYAVMEKSKRIAVLPAPLVWTDLGAWDQVLDVLPKDGSGNAALGDAILIDTLGCLVRTGPGMAVAAVGLRNLAIIAEPDAVLVCDLGSAQMVKKAVERLQTLRWPQTDVAAAPPEGGLRGEAEYFKAWLFTAALPLWWTLGADHAGWGYHESLDLRAAPTAEPRRIRVQARQAHAFAMAGRMGWKGPWATAHDHAITALLTRYARGDGLFRGLVAGGGETLDDEPRLYDLAFILLALASGRVIRPQAEAEANALLDTIMAKRRHPAGGYAEFGAEACLANPHMHLLEAALAWIEESGAPRWRDLAAEIAGLALTRLIDSGHGYVHEVFDARWCPLRTELGRRLEPGHQFEWSWLLERWSRLSGDRPAGIAARRLYEAGRRGVDEARGVAVDSMNEDFTALSTQARIWPQTERLKAALLFSESAEGTARLHLKADAMAASAALRRYTGTEVRGLWHDKMLADGTFLPEPVPASSLYHLVGAAAQLQATAGGTP